MLARSTSGNSLGAQIDDYVRPVTYTCRSLDEVHFHGGHRQISSDLNDSSRGNVIASDDCCVLDSLNSNHFSSGEESNMKLRRQSSEDFLEMQAARQNAVSGQRGVTQCNRGQYCQHRYEDFSSSPDPYDDYDEDVYEHEAMVDEIGDPLEMARQGTVHLWEDEDHHNSIAICHGGAISSDQAFLRTATSSEAATTASPEMGASGISDDAVLYCD